MRAMNGSRAMVGLLLIGLAWLAGGQVWAFTHSAVAGILVGLAALAGLAAAVLALKRRSDRLRKLHLLGEFQGEIGAEEGFVPVRLEQEQTRQRVQQKIAGRPERAADSIRGLLVKDRRPPADHPSSPRRRARS